MPSIRGSLEYFQPLIDVGVAAFDRPQRREARRGLIDTRATRTCITGRLVTLLELPMRTRMLVSSAQTHPERRRAYGFSLGLYHRQSGSPPASSLHVLAQELVAPDFRDNDGFDVLIGMDLISTGRLLMEGQAFEFSF